MNECIEDAIPEIEPPRNNPYLPEDVQELRHLEEITPIPSLLPVRKGTKEEQRELDETAFRLRARQKTYRQIADRLAVSVSTAHGMVKRHLHYQRTVLKEHLADVRDYELLLLREVLPQHVELAKHGDPRALGQVLEATRLKLRLLKFANPTVRDEELDATDPTRQLAKGYDEELLKQQERRDWQARVRRAEQEQAKLAAVGVQASACSGESVDLESHETVSQVEQQPKGCTPTGRRYLGDVTIEYRTIPEPEPNSVRTNPEQNPEQILQPVAAVEVARVEEIPSEQRVTESETMSAGSTNTVASLASIVGLLLLLLSGDAAIAWVPTRPLYKGYWPVAHGRTQTKFCADWSCNPGPQNSLRSGSPIFMRDNQSKAQRRKQNLLADRISAFPRPDSSKDTSWYTCPAGVCLRFPAPAPAAQYPAGCVAHHSPGAGRRFITWRSLDVASIHLRYCRVDPGCQHRWTWDGCHG